MSGVSGASSASWQGGSYVFPAALSLSNDAVVDSILADVPFLAVSLLGFGTLTFFFALSRTSIPIFYLNASVVFAFISSVLDLTQLLAAVSLFSTDTGNTHFRLRLVVALEIGYSVSIGLRLLFFWNLLSERPEPRRLRSSGEPDQSTVYLELLGKDRVFFSVSGFLVKWSLLMFIAAITILQMTWRLVKGMNMYGAIYVTDTVFEILVTTVLIVRMIWNITTTPNWSWWQAARYYVGPIVAALLGACVGIGNLIYFAFSECPLGRFLQAMELYALIVFMMISTCSDLDARSGLSSLNSPRVRSKALLDLPTHTNGRGAALTISTPVISRPISIPSMKSIVDVDLSTVRLPPRPRRGSPVIQYPSSLYGLSLPSHEPISWHDSLRREVVLAGPSTIADHLESKPVLVSSQPELQAVSNVDIAGRGALPSNRSQLSGDSVSRTSSPVLDMMQEAIGSVSVNFNDSNEALPSSRLQSRRASLQSKRSVDVPGAVERDSTGPPAMPSLDNMLYSLRGRMAVHESLSTSKTASASSFEEILRQQRELDRSIAVLRLISLTPAIKGEEIEAQRNVRNKATVRLSAGNRTLSVASARSRIDSASARSDFSLSNFPVPPPLPSTPLPQANDQNVPNNVDDPARVETPKVSEPPFRSSMDRVEMLGTGMREEKYDSAGTRYDVTSFIDGLAAPQPFKGQITDSLLYSPSSDTSLAYGVTSQVRAGGDDSPSMDRIALPFVRPTSPSQSGGNAMYVASEEESQRKARTLADVRAQSPQMKKLLLPSLLRSAQLSSSRSPTNIRGVDRHQHSGSSASPTFIAR